MRWQWIASGIIALQLTAVAALAAQAPHLPPVSSYLLIAGVFAVGLAYLTACLSLLVFKRPIPWQWIAHASAGFALVAVEWALIAWFKGMVPIVVGFTADRWLADLDQVLFFSDPWTLSHAALGWASPAIDLAYVTWSPLKIAALMALILLPRTADRNRLMIVYFLIVSIGTALQYLAPSAGPVFYDRIGLGARFSDLPLLPWVERASDYLWNDYQNPQMGFGTGISAFPSMHVAIACWIALVVRSQAPRFQWFAWVYLLVITVGSVHLGWHYAVDGLASLILVAVCYGAVTVFTSPVAQLRPAALSNRVVQVEASSLP
ncbi:phosphatase PAP2 family protein [Sphingomicrobium sp. XHP0235]|uniref:phosphatase PAP2 family protein n=1 Tax=Sphingomicrobium aquimarinum TaxID=3133971 RepID=UPI0031FEEA7A